MFVQESKNPGGAALASMARYIHEMKAHAYHLEQGPGREQCKAEAFDTLVMWLNLPEIAGVVEAAAKEWEAEKAG